MALIKCPECGQSVSDQAKLCPHCGVDIREAIEKRKPLTQRNLGCGTSLLIVLGLFILIGILTPKDYNSLSSSKPASAKQEALANIMLNYKWSKEGFGNVMELDFKIINKSKVDVKDLEITCQHFGPSGTQIDRNVRTIYESIKAGKTRSFQRFNMGFIHTQAARSGCSITDLVVLH